MPGCQVCEEWLHPAEFSHPRYSQISSGRSWPRGEQMCYNSPQPHLDNYHVRQWIEQLAKVNHLECATNDHFQLRGIISSGIQLYSWSVPTSPLAPTYSHSNCGSTTIQCWLAYYFQLELVEFVILYAVIHILLLAVLFTLVILSHYVS